MNTRVELQDEKLRDEKLRDEKLRDEKLRDEKLQDEISNLVKWLEEQIVRTKTQGLLVGVSGGVDSAAVAALIQRASPQNALGVILPCHSSPEDQVDAQLVCDSVGITRLVVDLTGPHETLLQLVQGSLEKVPTGQQATTGLSAQTWEISAQVEQRKKLIDGNLRARLRMCTLYSLANALNYLVVGTDNAAEIYTGYFTKYGDGGVDIQPLAEFTKAEVRELARYLQIPAKICTKPPTAGLWENQTDEEELGVTYQEIDAFLGGKGISADAHARLTQLHQLSVHKRRLPLVYPRIIGKRCQ